ncbi:T9SS type A sorting domain-containing protein [Algivirga pacifica]|uniref:Secretion system C-terminal sorting domain-containing protein n=1 Tax=Algivirga pacifica TaxID=1162670 RepID=A0ABP9DLB6_9BACT
MKTVNRIFGIIAVVLVTIISVSTTQASVAAFKPLAGGITYSFKVATGQQAATLVLKDMEGKSVNFILSDNKTNRLVMHRKFEGIKETKASLDFAALAAGEYKMVLQFEDNRVVRILEITDEQTVVMKDYQLARLDMPYQINLHGEDLNIIFNKQAERALDIKITDTRGVVVYSTSFVKGFKPVKHFDLSNLKSGIYYVRIKGQETDVTETIAL